ncbi:MAG: hypothetical protein ACYSRQ_05180 [Planctomycetota bacterium]|jgi:hypothetical protein
MFKYTLSAVIALIFISYVASASPKPAVVQGPEDWTLEAEFQHLQQISVKLANQDKPRRYWYLILTVTNNTGRDVEFYPECELMTDTFQITPAGKNVPFAVFERVKERYSGQYPFLEYIDKTSDKVLQGDDNSKDIAIIWQDFDSKAKAVSLFISGLSNESVCINHPNLKDESGQAVMVYLRKTLQLDYNVSGAPQLRENAKVSYKKHSWIMR